MKVSRLVPVQKLSLDLYRKFAVCFVCTTFGMNSCRYPEQNHHVFRIDAVSPETIQTGEIRLTGKVFDQTSKVRLDGHPLSTSVVNNSEMYAHVPAGLVKEPGLYPVSVEDESGAISNSVGIRVIPTDSSPFIRQTFPNRIHAGQPFNVQPSGGAAMGIVGANFLPKTVVEINGQPMETVFSGNTELTISVPDAIFARTGTLQIQIRNPDGKVSPVFTLKVEP